MNQQAVVVALTSMDVGKSWVSGWLPVAGVTIALTNMDVGKSM